ncbi:MAG: hypothetical protein GY754_32155 [bacterium]|nr:hypothetical protein [bacterium]
MKDLWNFPVSVDNSSSEKISAEITVPEDSPWFSGHFPGEPLLPGIAQLSIIFDLIEQHEKERGNEIILTGFKRVRYRQIVLPGETIAIEINPGKNDTSSYSFKILLRGEAACSGILLARKKG